MWFKAGCALFVGLSFCACDTASPEFRDTPAQTVTVGQSVFEVRKQGNRVELLRTNAEYAPTFNSIIPRASQAVVIATGCTPRPASWEGEQTLMQVEVDCADA